MELRERILKLKKEKNALILAHFYQIPEIQDVADVVGDSLALARIGAEAEEELIVLCGVKFMAETAKILSPEKKVLIPRIEAGCPMADTASYEAVKEYKEQHPDRLIVSYVNTTAKVKTLTDICVTSSNAVEIIKHLDEEKIMFLPDRNLGGYIKKQMPDKDIELWPGMCVVHDNLRADVLLDLKKAHPDAKVLAHPECREDVLKLADYIGSTKGIIDYVALSKDKKFIIATEDGILHPLRSQNPDKEFILAASCLRCRNMKKIEMADLYDCLNHEIDEIQLSKEIIEEGVKPLKRMLNENY